MRWKGMATVGIWVVLAATAAQAIDPPPADPEARRTWIAARRDEALQRRAEFLKLSPEEQEKVRNERRALRDERRQAREAGGQRRGVEIQAPLPMPVALGGSPAGESCPSGESCTLTAKPPEGQVLVVTAVWSASKIECDGVSAAAPPGGAVVSPWWRCAEHFSATGAGAGYLGFLIAK